MRGGADLHLHSRHSDGSHAPAEVVRLAVERGLAALSLTDHDTVAGWDEARAEGDRFGVKIIPGVELSARFEGHDIHLLAYGFDPDCPGLLSALAAHRQQRETRLGNMIERLQEAGIAIRFEDLVPGAPGGSWGRPHLADGLLRHGVVSSFQEAFDRFLNPGGLAYVPRTSFSVARAREVVDAAGGVLVLAHPHLNLSREGIRRLVGAGLDGLEVDHPRLKASQSRELRRLAREGSLLATGGSDCHGSDRGPLLIGSVRVSLDTVKRMEEACSAKRDALSAARGRPRRDDHDF